MFDLKQLPEPDDCGQFWHPDIPDDEGMTFAAFREFCLQNGFDAICIELEDSDQEDAVKQYFEDGDPDAMKVWNPTAPDGWGLIAKFDTEDGPVAWFVRPNAGCESMG